MLQCSSQLFVKKYFDTLGEKINGLILISFFACFASLSALWPTELIVLSQVAFWLSVL